MSSTIPSWVVRMFVSAIVVGFIAIAATGAAPSAPTGLTAQVAGSSVTLTWTPPSIGPVIGYRLEAGSASGQSDLSSTTIGPSSTLSAASVPNGTYFVRIRAIGLDGESAPSNEVIVTVVGGGCSTAPSPPLNVTSTVNGMVISLRWQPGGTCPASYVLHAGSAPGLSNVAIVNVGTALELTASAPAGTYYIRVHAQNAFGTSGPSNEIAVQVGATTGRPCDPAAFPGAVQWQATAGGNDHLYELVKVGRDITWDEARAVSAATGQGWHLATVTSAAENNFVESLLANDSGAFNCCLSSNASGPWLGASASTFQSNDWRWVTGEPFAFADWGPFEPYGNGDRLSYAEFGSSRVLAWNDVPSVYPLSPRAYVRECSGAPVPSPGGIVVLSNDDWVLSDTAFSRLPVDTANLAVNLARVLAGRSRRIHAYSDYFSLSGSRLATTLRNAGFTFSVGLGINFDLPTLSAFDAVFLGIPLPTSPQLAVLDQYVAQGGNVYIHAGNFATNPTLVPNTWNSLLARFALRFDRGFNGLRGNITVLSSHPLFAGVSRVYLDEGHPITGCCVVATTTTGASLFAVSQGGRIP